jgi:hypothetical protein
MKHTLFYDMHSGGSRKNSFSCGYVQGDEATATALFTDKYGNPRHVTCTCCGPDYSVDEFDSLEALKESYPEAIEIPL